MNNKIIRTLCAVFAATLFCLVLSGGALALADTGENVETGVEQTQVNDGTAYKAIAAGIAVGIAAATGAIGMGIAIAKSADSMARQPEASDKINSAMMLGLVFIETTCIYALIVAILIIFVL